MSGARQWWAHNGFDWSDFVTNGIPVEQLEATGDKFALDVSAIARTEHGRQ